MTDKCLGNELFVIRPETLVSSNDSALFGPTSIHIKKCVIPGIPTPQRAMARWPDRLKRGLVALDASRDHNLAELYPRDRSLGHGRSFRCAGATWSAAMDADPK